jgi:hypothetical protein
MRPAVSSQGAPTELPHKNEILLNDLTIDGIFLFDLVFFLRLCLHWTEA